MNQIYEKIYNNLYDNFLGNTNFKLSTPNLLLNVFNNLEENSKILDFGCGNGVYYSVHDVKKTIIFKKFKITGVDINKSYIKKCKQRVYENNLSQYVDIKIMNILDYKLLEQDKYDYIIFTESAPVISHKMLSYILIHMKENVLKNNGKIIFINNLIDDTDHNQIKIKKYKPYVKNVLLIDFGRALTKKYFKEISEQTGLYIENIELLNEMNSDEILKYFNLNLVKYFTKYVLRVKSYYVSQYAIKCKILNKNTIEGHV